MTNRVTAALAALGLTGCSFSMKPLPSGYDPRTIPRCDTDALYPIGDVLGALLMGAVVITAAATDPPQGEEDHDSEIIAAGVAGGLGFGLAAALGFGWDRSCKAAIKQWDERQIEQDEHLHGGRIESPDGASERADDEAAVRRQEEQRKQARKAAAAANPRGFFCAGSPTIEAAGLCARAKMDCARARGAALAAVPDLSECALVETAQCYQNDDAYWCAPTATACETQRAKVPDATPCAEER